MNRSRAIALALCVIGAAAIWFSTSGDLRSGTKAFSLLALAGVGALIAGRGILRRLVAVVVIFAGLGLMFAGTALSVVAGILVVAGGATALITCHTWPVMGGRYERAAKVERTDLWAALDRGEDPTATR